MTAFRGRVFQRHPLMAFFVLAYLIGWAFVPFGSFGAFAPLVAALIVVPLSQGRAGLREWGSRLIRWRVAWYWYAVAVGLPLAVHLVTAWLQVVFADRVFSLSVSSVTTFLMVLGLRLINPPDGPLGEEPGWRGFALPGLQGSGRSPLTATLILALLVTGWHVPLFFLEEGGLQPNILVAGLLTTVAVTFWYSWLFNHTRGSVLMTLVAHSVEGSIHSSGWSYMITWCAVAILLVVFNRTAWRRPIAGELTTQFTTDGSQPATAPRRVRP